MNVLLKNAILGIVALGLGLYVGGSLNMFLINISGSIIPPPDGVVTNTTEGLQEALHLFEPKHFLMPFLAHALGTLFGAFVAALIALKHKIKFALVIGCVFLIGGVMMVFMLPSPVWFTIVDISLAYIPMAYLGGRFAIRITSLRDVVEEVIEDEKEEVLDSDLDDLELDLDDIENEEK